MRNEDRLHDVLESVMPPYHLALDGAPEEGAAYRHSGDNVIYESGEPVMTVEMFQIYVFQKQYSAQRVQDVIKAIRMAGFDVVMPGQSMQNDYYSDEIRASRMKEE